ncbi:acetylornithine transaminase [Lentilactobacillus otakiensis]|uniref:Acetylornithine/succinyldiaminopimelate aminotransferase n=1 Tax=Lentilactobacillus otakiensis DSM 19908 = JCM 15040 TaxID=1423780 RepID=S4NRQ7_9LACO|nr:acetylornithine transaminase [Lentilactobacillus otakiensis]KRL09799.1 acetylornithine succinyldiaminopimelate aminotransferase [Lentilactobacillus otakiensis DSM 19908 = JCM 15040]MBZ3776145.1 acetylornithine transaminase [Lentilactobacillus otakiensis]MDV3517150.1 acetylornithine transaminase [Lentilactobacillus otakiensis]GAD16613.1 acetylornithine/succinyldiaminopimelate aminotransferase [Lentilactobacillus otakiensis DSM 19908 = JCM 15040]
MEHIFPTYAQYPMEIVSGHDWHLVDSNHKEYLDFTSGIGVCSFGYSNDWIEQSVINQLGKIWHTSNLYPSQLQDDVANALCPEGMLAFFCNSGTEANEAAFKLARKVTGKAKVLAFNNGFHGRTYGSMSLTGNPDIQAGFKPLVPEVSFADYNDPNALDAITDDLAAVILEVIQGEGGVVSGNGEWLQKVAAKCHEQGVLLIIDEVQTGIGRTGMKFAFQNFNLDPDIITCAKALGNGLPIGAMLGKKELASAFGPGSHGTTFGGNKIALASAKAVLEQLTPSFLENVQKKSQAVFAAINQEVNPLAVVDSVSGLGLMIGIHLNPTVKVADVIAQLQDEGLLTLSAKHNTLRLLPPLVMSESDLLAGIDQIADALANVAVQVKSESI